MNILSKEQLMLLQYNCPALRKPQLYYFLTHATHIRATYTKKGVITITGEYPINDIDITLISSYTVKSHMPSSQIKKILGI